VREDEINRFSVDFFVDAEEPLLLLFVCRPPR